MSKDRGVEAWTEHVDEFDRVRSIATTLSKPRSATYIAAEACVEEDTTREFLDRLASVGVLIKSDGKDRRRTLLTHSMPGQRHSGTS